MAGAWALLAISGAGILACGPEGAIKSQVEELRVLGIRAEPAEIAPGESTQVDALVADPFGGGRPVTWTWAVCTPDPFEGESSCSEEGRTVPLAVGTSAVLTAAPDTLDGLEPEAQERGIDLFLVLSIHADAVPGVAPEEAEIAFKRVRVSTDIAPNTNPVLERFEIPAVLPAGETVTLTAAATASSAESFDGPTGPRTEDLRFSWFTTAGLLDRSSTFGSPVESENDWEVETPSTFWLVVRDGRGGATWTTRTVP